MEIEGGRYTISDFYEGMNYFEFKIEEDHIKKKYYHSKIRILMDNGKTQAEDDCSKNLTVLANNSIRKFEISKEIIKEIKDKYELQQAIRLDETKGLLGKITKLINER